MPGPEDPTKNPEQTLAEPGDWNPASEPRPAAPDDDRFAAALAAARGTVSQELDLNDILEEPAIMVDDAAVGDRQTGS